MKAVWIVPAVAAAALLGFFTHRWLETGPTVRAQAGVEAGNAAGDAATDATAPTAGTSGLEDAEKPPLVIPETLPQFSLADREGRMRTLGDWAGQPVMVNYWATWCAPCRREIPLLNELRAAGRAQKLEVIGIAVDFREDVLKYASETPIDYPLLIGEEDGLKAVEALGMQPAFPFTVFADSKQRILTVKVGELHRDEAELILARLAAVDAGTLSQAQAKIEIDAGLKELATRRAAQGETDQPAAATTGTGTAG